MVKKESVKIVIICIILALWIAVPTSVNVNFAIVLSNTTFRLNIWLSIILILILLPLIYDGKIKKKFDKLYILFLVYCSVNTGFHLLLADIGLFTGIDAILTITLPYILVKGFSSIKKQQNKKIIINFVKLLGIYIVLQVFFTSVIARLRRWDSSVISDRASTTLGESNCTAYFLVAICALLIALYIKKSSKIDLVQLLFTILAVLLSQSRGAIGCLIVIFAIALLMSNIKNKFKIVVFGIIGLVGIYVWKPDIYINLYLRIFTDQSKDSNLSRVLYLDNALDTFFKQPFTGYGNGLLIYRLSRVERYLTDIPNPHNQWGALLAETGLVGIILFVASQFSYIKHRVNKGWECKFLSFSLAFYIVVGFMFETMYTNEIRTSICFWLYWFIIEYFNDIQYDNKITKDRVLK